MFHMREKTIDSLFNDGVVSNNKYILCFHPMFIAVSGHLVQCFWIHVKC